MNVLGISLGHDVSSTLLKDGDIVAAVQEERLSRIKLHDGFPALAIEEMLNLSKVKGRDIDVVAVGWGADYLYEVSESIVGDYYRCTNIRGESSSVIENAVTELEAAIVDGIYPTNYKTVNALTDKVVKAYLLSFGIDCLVQYIDHHLSHAASVYYTSPWDKALIVTSDGKGCGLAATCTFAQGGSFDLCAQVDDSASIANFYAAVTRFLGYKANRHEGKITGLAAFGDSSKNMLCCGSLFRYDTKQQVLVNELSEIWQKYYPAEMLEYLESLHDPNKDGGTLEAVKRSDDHIRRFRANYILYRNYFENNLADKSPEAVAAYAQDLLEKVVVEQVADVFAQYDTDKICLAGGLFANVKLNQRIREIRGVDNVYIYPAMGDSGTSAGAALYVYMQTHEGENFGHACIDNVYLGRSFDKEDIKKAVLDAGYEFNWLDNPAPVIAKAVHEGKVVGFYNGRAEWGPRALGNRTIFVRPTDKSINDQLNKRLSRTEFMPFAPVVLAEYASDYFVGYENDHIAAKYMTMTYDVYPDKVEQCQAVVHVDNTARPQVVTKADNAYCYDILQEYYKLSSIPMLVNTSFNMHEEPMVYTPTDALRAFECNAVDVLVLGNCIIER